MTVLAAALCGFLFGWGLLVSQMFDPAKVLGFLDIAGDWDPSLAVTMVAALAVTSAGYALARSRAPALVPRACLPSAAAIDRKLVTGALLFGTGWGLVGLCPGPALVDLASLSPDIIVFVAAMAAGMVLFEAWNRPQPAAPVASVAAGDG